MEAISLLICKEGFTTPKVKNLPVNISGPDKNLVWGAEVEAFYDTNKNNLI